MNFDTCQRCIVLILLLERFSFSKDDEETVLKSEQAEQVLQLAPRILNLDPNLPVIYLDSKVTISLTGIAGILPNRL